MHIALATLASSVSDMTPASWIGFVLGFIGVVALCINGWRKERTGKLSIKLFAVGFLLFASGLVLMATTLRPSP